MVRLGSNQLPKVGEWTRIEISHEEADGKYFLALSLGGKELGRKEMSEQKELVNVKFALGHHQRERCQLGFIRRLVVLEKQ